METLKVLIVDDEPGIRSGIQRILRNFTVELAFIESDFDFELFESATGEDAIEFVENNACDIVLLDNKLPGILGVEVLEHIKKKKLDILVMMITSYASLDLAVKATQNGAYDFVQKPFTPQELKSSMEKAAKHLYLKRMTQQMAQAGKKVRFQFLSVLSHELKAPLNAVEGYLRIMKDRQAGDKLESYDQMIDRSFERIKGMRNLIMDLLDLTKIESGKKTQELHKICLNEVAKTAIETIQPYAIQRDVKINFSYQNKICIIADADEMEIIFNNLISNAVKYNRDHGSVDLVIVEIDENIKITIKDSGIGMSDEDLEKLFKDFSRIKNTKTRNITGSGLGLSIIKKIIDLYEGEVNVESIPDVGTTFTVILPKDKTKVMPEIN